MTWQPLYTLPVYGVLGAAVVALIWAARRWAVTPKLRSWSILGLRASVLALLMLILFNPVEQRETHLPPEPASLAVLVDCSKSMAMGESRSRLEEAKQILHQAMTSPSIAHRPRVDIYRFGKHLKKVPGLIELSAEDNVSRIRPALERLPARFQQQPPRAVVIVSDGALQDAERVARLGKAYKEREVPLHTVAVGDDALRGDVGIHELAVPPRVTDGDVATIRTVLKSRGFSGERVVLAVRAAGRTDDVPPLATMPLTLQDGRQIVELVVQADQDVGRMVLEVPELRGEATAENNRIPFRLHHRDRRLNVLYMEGTHSREYRWLRDALQEDSDIRCMCLVVNNQYAQRPRLQRVEDPYRGFPTTRDELFEYDVIICSDISQSAFTPEQIRWTVELVAERGGGFVMIGGHTSFGSGGWDRTEWEKLIPFDMTGQRSYVASSFEVDIPREIVDHPIWKIVDDPDKNRNVLEQLPRFLGTNLIARAKPAATILGVADRGLPRVGSAMPVFAAQPFGRGRTFAMSTDTTLDWGRYFESRWGEGDNRYYRKFWRNTVRWLAENSQASQKRLHVATDKVIYKPGEPIQITAEAFDEQLQPTTDYRLEAKLVAPGEEETGHMESLTDDRASNSTTTRATELTARPEPPGYTGQLAAQIGPDRQADSTAVQAVQLVVSAWKGDEQVAMMRRRLQLLDTSDEWFEPRFRPDVLEELAKAGGGQRLNGADELATLLSRFEPTPGKVLQHTVPRWDHPLIWTAILGLLGTEWTLRRLGAVRSG